MTLTRFSPCVFQWVQGQVFNLEWSELVPEHLNVHQSFAFLVVDNTVPESANFQHAVINLASNDTTQLVFGSEYLVSLL